MARISLLRRALWQKKQKYVASEQVCQGGVGIADQVTVGTEAIVGAASGVGSDVPAGSYVFGYPAVNIDRALEQYRYLGRQKMLHRKINEIAARLENLERR